MVLKRVELFGFKSFADRTKIEFQEGISALLGPNGCGKSNVVDAIKWVLGEQSSRSLRAEKMEDVIFNGTESRKALNIAEVTLVLDNEKNLLPLEVAEIAIKRRLYRSGESEYFVNNTPVRLKELREIFFDTGVGKSAYSVMEQGKIDQILSNKPEERRYIFEEAAGITKYKVKGAEAERKLIKTEENMRQVEGILREVKRSYDSLHKQAQVTGEYRKVKDEIFKIELDILLLKLKQFISEKDRKQLLLEEQSGLRDKLKTNIDEINESLEENLDLVNTMESRLIENQKKLYGLDVEKNSRENQIKILKERVEELQRQIELNQKRQKNIKDKIGDLQNQLKEKDKERVNIQTRLEEIGRNIEDFQHSIKTAELNIQKNDHDIQKKEQEIVELEKQQQERQDQLRGITDDIVAQLDKGLKDSGISLNERKAIESKIEEILTALRIQLEGKLQLFSDYSSFAAKKETGLEKLVDRSKELIRESLEKIDDLVSFMASYKKTVPQFIEDFTSPEGIIMEKRVIDQTIEQIRTGILRRKEDIQLLARENRAASKKIDEYRKTLENLRVNQAQMKMQEQGIDETIQRLSLEKSDQEKLLEDNYTEIERGKNRVADIFNQTAILKNEKMNLEKEEKALLTELTDLEKGISTKNKDLINKEKKLKTSMGELGKIQTKLEQAQIDLASIKTEIKNIYDNFREQHSRELSEFEDRIFAIKSSSRELVQQNIQKKGVIKGLGQVNLMAPEEFAEVKERYDFLNNQVQDLSTAREDLKRITKEIKKESEELFLDTYDKIKKSFHSMFRRLFGGGRAEIKLMDPETVLTSGIEVYAQPPGKKLENISLLSGGEKSLAAVALLFATYMVRPSPFCILDEIDAALDEANVGRFVNLLTEFGERSQFIVITHNKKTVAGANSMLGVTMEESGISRVVAVRLENAKEKVTN